MTNAEIIYDSILEEKNIAELFNVFETENLHFDFKRTLEPSGDNFRNLLGKSVSGFSNADGGVLIFGVQENSGQTPRFSLEPFEGVENLNAKVQTLISRVTDPPNTKIVSKIIRPTENQNRGYCVVLIPRSETAPHQDVNTRKYYQRAGESHKEMYHYQIADLFGRRAVPKLRVIGKLQYTNNEPGCVDLEIWVENVGMAVARFPFIQIQETGFFVKDRFYNSWFLKNASSRLPNFYSSNSDMVIQPNVMCPAMEYHVNTASFNIGNTEIFGRIGGEGIPTRNFKLAISSAEVQQVYGRTGIQLEIHETSI